MGLCNRQPDVTSSRPRAPPARPARVCPRPRAPPARPRPARAASLGLQGGGRQRACTALRSPCPRPANPNPNPNPNPIPNPNPNPSLSRPASQVDAVMVGWGHASENPKLGDMLKVPAASPRALPAAYHPLQA